jgi:hypothetical protein
MSADDIRAKMNGAKQQQSEAPLPLMREQPPAEPFPVEAIGSVLEPAARAIQDIVQAPMAICAQSVLAAATLAVQGHADVMLPTGQTRPICNFLITVAQTGERKTAADQEALAPIIKREARLRDAWDADYPIYKNAKMAWDKARDFAIKHANGDPELIKQKLAALGDEPTEPLVPLLTCAEPTYEGLVKLLMRGHPSIGIFAGEGGQFIGGHGLSNEAKLRTAAGLSDTWDGTPIKRVRAGDGIVILPGRRVAMHLLAQPGVAAEMLSDGTLLDQGLLSRVLASAPDPTSGTREWREPDPRSRVTLNQYCAQMLRILDAPLPLRDGAANELTPRALTLSAPAVRAWIAFYSAVEPRLASGGELDPIRGLANKLPEHAARLAAVLTLVRNLDASEIGADEMNAGTLLAAHYASEALGLFGVSRTNPELKTTRSLLEWLLKRGKPIVSLPCIYRLGPSAVRDKASAARHAAILENHRHLIRIPEGAEIDGKYRRDVWRVVQ